MKFFTRAQRKALRRNTGEILTGMTGFEGNPCPRARKGEKVLRREDASYSSQGYIGTKVTTSQRILIFRYHFMTGQREVLEKKLPTPE